MQLRLWEATVVPVAALMVMRVAALLVVLLEIILITKGLLEMALLAIYLMIMMGWKSKTKVINLALGCWPNQGLEEGRLLGLVKGGVKGVHTGQARSSRSTAAKAANFVTMNLAQFVTANNNHKAKIAINLSYFVLDVLVAATIGVITGLCVGPLVPVVGNWLARSSIMQFLLHITVLVLALSSQFFPYGNDAPKKGCFPAHGSDCGTNQGVRKLGRFLRKRASSNFVSILEGAFDMNLIIMVACFLWKDRDSLIFKGSPSDPRFVAASATSLMSELLDASSSNQISSSTPLSNHFSVSPLQAIKNAKFIVFCDGAFDLKLKRSATANVLLNNSFSIMHGVAREVVVSSPIVS
ncbi:hypothetical protein LguiB_009247 [Lonicera macranthoides]